MDLPLHTVENFLLTNSYTVIKEVLGSCCFYFLYALFHKFIPLAYVPERYKDVSAICYIGVKYGSGEVLRNVPKNLRTKKLCLLSYSISHRNLIHFPPEFITEELAIQTASKEVCMKYLCLYTENTYIAALKNCECGRCFSSIENKTYKMCLAAVETDGYAVKHVPLDFLTPEICLAAVTNYGNAIKFIPLEYLTNEICLAAANQNERSLKYISQTAPHLISKKVWKKYCYRYKHVYEYLPEYLKNNALYEKLARIGLIQYIPEDKRTEEYYLTSYEENKGSIEYMPPHLQTYERCLESVEFNVFLIDCVPQEIIDKKMALIIINSYYNIGMIYIPHHLFDEELIYYIIENKPELSTYIPIDKINKDMCYAIIRKSSFNYFHRELITKELCLYALDVCPDVSIYYFSPKHFIPESRWLWFIENGGMLSSVPIEYVTDEMINVFLHQYGRKYSGFSEMYYKLEELLTEDICYDYLSFTNFKKWSYIPAKFVKSIVGRVIKNIENETS